MKLLHGVLGALSLGALGLAVACTLNPQPLPPETPDGSIGVDAGSFNQETDAALANAPTPDEDAGDVMGGGGGSNDADAGTEGGTDRGEGGAPDASTDADAG